MKNIDKELIDWALQKIDNEFKDEISLLLGMKGACKTPGDEYNLSIETIRKIVYR